MHSTIRSMEEARSPPEGTLPRIPTDPGRDVRRARRVGWLALGAIIVGLISLWGRVFFFDSAPPDDADLLRDPVPEGPAEENGWRLLQEHAGSLSIPDIDEWFFAQPASPVIDADRYCFDFSKRSEWVGSETAVAAHEFIRANEAVYRLVDGILARPRFVIASEEFSIEEVTLMRQCARLLIFRSEVALFDGRLDDAIDDALRVATLAWRLEGSGNASITHALIAGGLEQYGIGSLLRALEDSNVRGESLLRIAERLDECSSSNLPLEDILRAEYIYSRVWLTDLEPESNFKPVRTLGLIAGQIRTWIELSRVPFAERDHSRLDSGRLEVVLRRLGGNSAAEGSLWTSRGSRSIDAALLRDEFDRRALSLAVALCRYGLREGTLPPALDLLVPEFIEALPEDPFTGGPIRYDPVRAILWSPGSDGIDRGGSTDGALNGDHEEPTIRIPTP